MLCPLAAAKDSAAAQNFEFSQKQIEIYSTLGGTPHLDGEYTVFGQVVEGLNIIDSIAAVGTASGDRPLTDIVMNITIQE